MRKSMTRRGDDGMAMLVGLVFVSVALMITGIISVQLVSQDRQIDVYQDVNATYQALDNANELARIDIEAGGNGIIGLTDWTPQLDSDGRIVLPALDASGVEPVEMELVLDEESGAALTMRFIAYTVDWYTDNNDTNGNGVADPDDTEFGLYTVHARAEVVGSGSTAYVLDMVSPLQVQDIQMASASFDVAGLVDEVQFAQVSDAALSSYAVLPTLLNGQNSDNSTTISRETEVVHQATEISIWGNAIFAGDGAIGATINGNVSICGGVHILGEYMLNGSMAITSPDDPSMEMSGTSFIHNNYHVGSGSAPPQRMWDSVPALPTKYVNGKDVATLNANLRVKHGTVEMQGNAEIGEPNDDVNDEKELMDGTYVTDGFSDTEHVYSDNGFDEPYDLGNKLGFPTLDDQYKDTITKQPVSDSTNPNGPNGTYTHQDYFTEFLVGDPNSPTDGILDGNLTLTVGGCADPFSGPEPPTSKATGLNSPVDNQFEMASEVNGIQFGNIADASLTATSVLPALMQGAKKPPPDPSIQPPPPGNGGGNGGGGDCKGNFYYNATTHTFQEGGTLPALPTDPNADFIMFDAATGKLNINGQIALKGNLVIEGANGAVIDFTGRGAIMAIDGTQPGEASNPLKGNISIQASFLSKNADGTVEDSFPQNNIVGFMADQDLYLGTGSHRDIMGPFYAEGTVQIDKQSQVMGTIVGSYFNIGNQVPNIYQIPTLKTNLPSGMIGAIPLSVLQVRSWREINPTEASVSSGNG